MDIGEKGQPREGKSWSKAVEESQVPQASGGESAHRLTSGLPSNQQERDHGLRCKPSGTSHLGWLSSTEPQGSYLPLSAWFWGT